MLETKNLILVKIETGGYGVDAVPTPAADAVLVSNLSLAPAMEPNEHTGRSGSLSAFKLSKPTIGPFELKFSVELKGSGTANVAPEYGPLLRIACMPESILAGPNRVEYDLAHPGPSASIYAYPDGLLHKCLGSVSNAEIVLEAGKKGMINFTVLCPFIIPTDVPIPSGAVYDTTVAPLIENLNLSIGGYNPAFAKVSINLNNTISKRTSGNAPWGLLGMEVTDRKVQGSIDPEAVTRATHDFWQLVQDATAGAFSCVAGTTAGNRFTITGPQVQYSQLGYGARNQRRTYELGLHFARNAGDDELKIKQD